MTELENKLRTLAKNVSKPFCYSCYEIVDTKSGHCKHCGSDDSARIVAGVGVDFGLTWVVDHILKAELESANLESSFEDMMAEVYPESTTVGFCSFNTVDLLKNNDPIAWKIALDEHIDSLEQDESVFTHDNGSTYYWANDVKNLIKDI